MNKFVFRLLVLSLFLIPFANSYSALAGEVDLLIEKLVEKGVLSPIDAKDLVKEIQKESAKEKEAVKKVAAETAKEAIKEKSKKGSFEIPQWVKTIKPFGDIRIRHDTQWKDYGTYDTNRNRERFRLRFGFKVKTSKTTEVGVRLASGSGFQNTTNQSFDSHGRGKNIFIDRAYAKWKPCKNFTLVGGKFKNPLFTSPLVWDPDVNPEGLAESISFEISDNVSLFAHLGQWFIEEESSTNDDPTLLTYQIGTEIKPSKDIKINLGASYYDFFNLNRIKYDAGDIGDKETFIGYNNGTNQQMVFDADNELKNEFRCLEFQAKAKFKNVMQIPFSVFGSFIKNFDADMDNLAGGGIGATGLTNYGNDDRDSGWLAGFDLGSKKKKGDWYGKYYYQELECYAFPAVFVDSDFHGGGTNNKGHYLQTKYHFTDNILAAATGFFTKRDDERLDGQKDEDRIQLDVIIKFP